MASLADCTIAKHLCFICALVESEQVKYDGPPAQADLTAFLHSALHLAEGTDSFLLEGFGQVTASRKADHIAAVASGSALAGIESTPKLWDIAASLLILSEAGGCYRILEHNRPIFPLSEERRNYERISFPLLAAANQSILSEVEASIVPR
jgi:fructose-1,6-bisphosphatase/inositol monophosphatase family enzyme